MLTHLYLTFGHAEVEGQLRSFGACQVFLLLKGLLENVDLMPAEGRSGVLLFSVLFDRTVLIHCARGEEKTKLS